MTGMRRRIACHSRWVVDYLSLQPWRFLPLIDGVSETYIIVF
jgi:hypothetical protein